MHRYVTNNSIKHQSFVGAQLNSSCLPIDRTLSVATIPDQDGPGSDGNKEILHIPQSSSITGALLSDF